MNAFWIIGFLILLCLVGCADYRPIPGTAQDMGATDAAVACVHYSYRVVPENTTGELAAGLVAGAVGGIVVAVSTDETSRRTVVARECLAGHGWIDVSGN